MAVPDAKPCNIHRRNAILWLSLPRIWLRSVSYDRVRCQIMALQVVRPLYSNQGCTSCVAIRWLYDRGQLRSYVLPVITISIRLLWSTSSQTSLRGFGSNDWIRLLSYWTCYSILPSLFNPLSAASIHYFGFVPFYTGSVTFGAFLVCFPHVYIIRVL